MRRQALFIIFIVLLAGCTTASPPAPVTVTPAPVPTDTPDLTPTPDDSGDPLTVDDVAEDNGFTDQPRALTVELVAGNAGFVEADDG